MKPEVSVLMATFNSPKYLREAIESVQRQTLRNFELIIIDESNDGVTRDILYQIAAKDKRIIVREASGLGLNRSLNLAIDMAKGDFLARMDADDVCMPTRFEQQVAYLKKHPEIGVVGTWAKIIDEDGVETAEFRTPVSPEACKRTIIKAAPFIHPSIMARRSIMEKYHPKYKRAEDYELWARMIRKTKFSNIPEFLLNYRQDFSTNVSVIQGKETEWNALKVRWKLLGNGTIPPWQVLHLIRPSAMFLVPMRSKVWLIKRLRKQK